MPLNESASFLVSTVLSVLTFSTMQILKPAIASTPVMTVVGGLIGALLFLFLLTAVGNLEKCVFGSGFASKWVEVSACLAIAVAASGSVHRVSATCCVLFSSVVLWGMVQLTNEVYGTGVGIIPGNAGSVDAKSKKKR